MDREAQEEMLAQAKQELQAAQRQVSYLKQVIDGLTGLLRVNDGGRDSESSTEGQWSDFVRVGSTAVDNVLSRVGITTVPGGAGTIRTYPKPRDAVLMVLQQKPGEPLAPNDIYLALREGGLVDPRISSGANAYNTALRRLADESDSLVYRTGQAQYVYHPIPVHEQGVPDSEGS